MSEQALRRGIGFMVLTTLIFALQDGITRHLSAAYPPPMVVMIRFWAFAAFTLALAARQPGGILQTARTAFPLIQAFRGLVLVVQITMMSVSFVKLGLIETHAVATSYPLIVVALSGPILGEVVGWRRWLAVAVGFVGEMIILAPGFGVFSLWALLPAIGAVLFALYSLATRYVAGRDSPMTSFLYTGTVGAVAMTCVGFFFWQPMTPGDWMWMGLLCLTSTSGHWCLIRAYSLAEASTIQPFAYLQLVWVSALALLLFGEVLHLHVAIGAALVVLAGLFALWRQYVRAKGQSQPVVILDLID
jgi:drug/metabolite transporter (DMT)-like permease